MGAGPAEPVAAWPAPAITEKASPEHDWYLHHDEGRALELGASLLERAIDLHYQREARPRRHPLAGVARSEQRKRLAVHEVEHRRLQPRRQHLAEAIIDYGQRQRRFGSL